MPKQHLESTLHRTSLFGFYLDAESTEGTDTFLILENVLGMRGPIYNHVYDL